MRCAIDGQAFRVAFDRSDPGKKWRIARIAQTSALRANLAGGAPEATAPTLETNDVDWSGWYCAACGHGREQVTQMFFQCSSCHELICGAKVRTLSPGIDTVECRPGCDGSGRLTGQISSYVRGVGEGGSTPGAISEPGAPRPADGRATKPVDLSGGNRRCSADLSPGSCCRGAERSQRLVPALNAAVRGERDRQVLFAKECVIGTETAVRAGHASRLRGTREQVHAPVPMTPFALVLFDDQRRRVAAAPRKQDLFLRLAARKHAH